MSQHDVQCKLLDGMFGYLIQLGLCVVAICVLIGKYILIEKRERPLDVWMKDVSKQIIGLSVAHLWNMLFAMVLATNNGNNLEGDECSAYFVNYLIDNTIGTLLNCLMIYLLNKLVNEYRDELIYLDTGVYSAGIKAWFYQLCAWIAIIVGVKCLLFGTIIYPLRTVLLDCGNWLMRPIVNNNNLELIIVMVIVPLICNIFQFVLQDLYLRHKGKQYGLLSDRELADI